MCDSQALKWVSALWFLVLRLVALLPLSPASASQCTLPSPRNVHFVSKNMKNVLHWLPPEGIAEDELSYTVKYLIYGRNKWIKTSECKNISQTWCDLSLETYDHNELYHASVKAFSNGNCSSWAESSRFNPLTDSQIDPPAFAMSSTEKSISVIVAPPEKWKRDPREKPVYLHKIYPGLQYNVSVFNKTIRKRWMFHIKNNRLDVLQLESNTVYCVTVQVYITPLLFSGCSKESCIATLEACVDSYMQLSVINATGDLRSKQHLTYALSTDPTSKQMTTILLEYVLPALLIGLLILVSSCCIYRYMQVTDQAYPKNLVLKNSNKYQGDIFVSFEKTVVNIISVNIGDQCKTFQEDIHLLGSAENQAGEDCAGNRAKKEPSNVLEDKTSQELRHDEEAVLKNEQDGNGPRMLRLQSHDTLGQRQNEDVVVYEFDVRGEGTIPTEEEEQEELHIGVLGGWLHNSPKALSGFVADETEQSYCPQYDVRPPETFSAQKLKELLSDKMDLVPENHQVPRISLVTDDQGFCPECGVVTDICVAPDTKEPFWDEKGIALRETQTLTFTVTRNAATAASYCPQFAKWTSQDQEGENEQNTVIDWDPQTGIPFLPDLSNLTNKEITETEKQEDLLEEGILSRLYDRQCFDELSEKRKHTSCS